jgi:1,4-alpha-glucan branching enzyme
MPEVRAAPVAAAQDPQDAVGDLAIVLHSHMPYVEGFGTWPFGEEWLFDAFARSHLPVLEVARELPVTVTVTPVLADQLEDPGAATRMRAFLAEHRLAAAERDATAAERKLRPAAEAEAAIYRRAIESLDALSGPPLEAFARAGSRAGVELMASAATHAVLPLLATKAGRRLQIDAGLRSHARRFGPARGFWLPECAYRPGLDGLLAERGVEWFCVDQSDGAGELDALAPIRSPAGPVAFPLDWPTVSLVWSAGGYPAEAAYLEYHRQSVNGIRLWAIGGEAYDPDAARRRAAEHAAEFAAAVAGRLATFAERGDGPGLVTFAIDTELLGAWWTEGAQWLGALARAAPDHGVRLVTVSEAVERHEPRERPLRASTWGERKDLSTWDSPAVADLAWGARRLELRLLRELGAHRLDRDAAHRAARELLAVQSSDWAFLDSGRQAGEYPFGRAVHHAQAMHEAIDSGEVKDPRVRSLAPDLSLAPLLEP